MSEPQYQGDTNQRWGHISYAQHADDFMIINLFEMLEIKKPSYLDLGAHDPIEISNTALIYRRGSRGVNIEANPSLLPAFLAQRSEDINVNVGVGVVSGTQDFYMYDDRHGCNTFSEEETRTMSLKIQKVMRLKVITLVEIVNKYCPDGKFPDLLLSDLEGMDYQVLEHGLKAHDNLYNPKVVCVETRRKDSQKMALMMASKGFQLYCRMGENLFFVRTDLIAKVF